MNWIFEYLIILGGVALFYWHGRVDGWRKGFDEAENIWKPCVAKAGEIWKRAFLEAFGLCVHGSSDCKDCKPRDTENL